MDGRAPGESGLPKAVVCEAGKADGEDPVEIGTSGRNPLEWCGDPKRDSSAEEQRQQLGIVLSTERFMTN